MLNEIFIDVSDCFNCWSNELILFKEINFPKSLQIISWNFSLLFSLFIAMKLKLFFCNCKEEATMLATVSEELLLVLEEQEQQKTITKEKLFSIDLMNLCFFYFNDTSIFYCDILSS